METENQESPSANWELYWNIIRRRRWWILGPTFLCWALTWGVSWFLPSVYRSETLILVEQQRVPEHYVIPNVAVDLQERLQSMTQQILSRTRLETLIAQLHLYASSKLRLAPDELVELMRKDIKIDLVQTQTPGRPDELTAFKISYLNEDPTLAQQVTSNLTSFFIDENLRSRAQAAEDTTTFLDNQLRDARRHLEEQEQRLRQFKGQYLGQLPGQLQSNLQILGGLQGQLQDQNERLGRAEQQKVYLKSLISQYRALSAQIRRGNNNSELSPKTLGDQLQKLKSQLAELQAKYTDNHPGIVYLEDQIAITEKVTKQIDAEIAAAKNTGSVGTDIDLEGADPKTVSPILELQSQLKANELEIDNRKRDIKQLEAVIGEYKSRLNETPVREQQLADLTRDYDQSRANYESLLAKKNQSELATNLEKQQQGETFRVLDPPSLPKKPYWPNRLLMSFGGIAVGLVLGIMGSALVEVVDDRVRQAEDLVTAAPIPVLAMVPPLVTPTEQRGQLWRARLEVVAALLITVVIVGASVFTYYKG